MEVQNDKRNKTKHLIKIMVVLYLGKGYGE